MQTPHVEYARSGPLIVYVPVATGPAVNVPRNGHRSTSTTSIMPSGKLADTRYHLRVPIEPITLQRCALIAVRLPASVPIAGMVQTSAASGPGWWPPEHAVIITRAAAETRMAAML